jgi:ankyrin repeat protein
MKPSRRKLLGLVVLLLLVLSLCRSVAQAFREGRQQTLNRALITAIKKNDANAVIALLAKGADANAEDLLPGHQSAWQRIWDSLRQKHVSLADTPTALLVTLKINDAGTFPPENVPLVKALLDAGAAVNVSDKDQMTPLMWAVLSTKLETVSLLLDRGATINTRDAGECTALYYACSQSDQSLVKLLIARGAQVNITGYGGRSPLERAALYGRSATVRMLLDSGADVNFRDKEGVTPLSCAAFAGNADCVKLLLARGAQVNTKDNEGNTPLARAPGYQEIVNMLKKAGAKK